jgi:hypothetical protein
MTPSDPLPLAAAQARLGRPGRPRKHQDRDKRVTDAEPRPPEPRMNGGREARRTPVDLTSALLPRLLSVPAAGRYLSLSEDTILELLQAGIFQRITVPAPLTAKRRGTAIRKVLLDRLQLDDAIVTWRESPR